ncbi:MAG TPA: M12 family metallopeptidase [Steroidobacteraceae bacterium]|nr:M12 family metallopeptidase [Steroidobacteraceae bacterium]
MHPLRSTPLVLVVSLLSQGTLAQPPLGAPAPQAKATAVGGGISSPRTNSITIAYPQFLWPKVAGVATVYYRIDAASDPNATPNIEAAIALFNADFPNLIQWIPWSPAAGPNYVNINLSASDNSGICETAEGYEAMPAQPMTGSTDCSVGTLLHEMGHVIGLWHEHSRPDRDTYVSVNYGNVIKGSWGNFLIATDDQQTLVPYDYASVMQYVPYAFTRNGQPVIESIPAGIPLAGYAGVPAQAGSGGPALPAFDYSAGDKETIQRLYGAAPSAITVTSNPTGLSVIVDGVMVTTPRTYAWPLYSSHTLDVPAGVQALAGYILNSNPPVAATYYYVYGRWNDSPTQAHAITVKPGTGSPLFPATTPQLTTYAANFVQLVPYAAAVYPAATGQVAVSPLPQSYAGSADTFLVARAPATLTATPNSGWNFYEFNNSPFWLAGGLGANPKTFNVPDTGNPVDLTTEFSNTPVYTIDVQPAGFSANLYAYVDSQFTVTPRNFSSFYDPTWIPGSKHALSLDATEYPHSSNSRYHFTKWSDHGALTHTTAALPAVSTTYVATVQPQYQPANNFSYPPCGGSASVSPTSPGGDGFYPSGQKLNLTATPDAGWAFAGWSYDLKGTINPHTLAATDETLVFANFNTVATPLALTSLKPASATAGGKAFTLTLTGTGFTGASLVYANGQYRSPATVTATKITVAMTAADIASPGAFQVFVENFPAGWNGCAVFGYQTFLVAGKGAPAAKPVFSLKAGTYHAPQTVSISDPIAGATIYYTTDGTTPTAASPIYTTPISVSSTETLKANAVATGYLKSAVTTAKYTIN